MRDTAAIEKVINGLHALSKGGYAKEAQDMVEYFEEHHPTLFGELRSHLGLLLAVLLKTYLLKREGGLLSGAEEEQSLE